MQFAERAAPRYWLSTKGKGIVMRRLAVTDMTAKVRIDSGSEMPGQR
jgi:hypothetical protein